MSAIDEALKFFGSQVALARAVGVSPQAVNQWITGRRPISVRLAIRIETLTKGKITCKQLLPHLYENDEAA